MASTDIHEEKSTSLGDLIIMMTDSMRIVASVAANKKVTEEEILECELLVNKFNEDFNPKLLSA